jgi:GTP cyclohydrolase I
MGTRLKLTDKQNEPDFRGLPIQKVGVKGVRFPIQVLDRARIMQDTIATIGLYVDLPKHFKGTHMSRFIEVLNEHGRIIHVDSIPDILRAIQNKFKSESAYINIEFPYFITKKAPVSGIESLMDYRAGFIASVSGSKIDFVLEVTVPVATVCPCSKAISSAGAHNQRGLVTVQVRYSNTVWIEELIETVETSASSGLYALLKREDEKAVTESAFNNPVFVEDLVRNVAFKLKADSRISWFKIEAETFESIHNHNAYACIESDSKPVFP